MNKRGFFSLHKTISGHHGWCKICGGLLQRDKNNKPNPNGIYLYFDGINVHVECLEILNKEVKIQTFNMEHYHDKVHSSHIPLHIFQRGLV